MPLAAASAVAYSAQQRSNAPRCRQSKDNKMTADRVSMRLIGLAASAVATLAIVAALDGYADRSVARTKLYANVVRLEPVTITAQRPLKQAAQNAAGKRL
jgi:uncharacterized protein YcfJ